MYLTVTRHSGRDFPRYLLHVNEDAAREFLERFLRGLFDECWGDEDPSDILLGRLSAWDPEERWTSLIGHAEEINGGALAEYHPISAPKPKPMRTFEVEVIRSARLVVRHTVTAASAEAARALVSGDDGAEGEHIDSAVIDCGYLGVESVGDPVEVDAARHS